MVVVNCSGAEEGLPFPPGDSHIICKSQPTLEAIEAPNFRFQGAENGVDGDALYTNSKTRAVEKKGQEAEEEECRRYAWK